MKMTAAVMFEQGLPAPYADSQPFRIEQVDVEGPGEGEVLVEVRAAGLCHSDLAQVAGLRKRKLPVVGGHEGAGIVREVGAGVTRLKPGDHVIMSVVAGCGCCRSCFDSRPALCNGVTASRKEGLLANGNIRMSLDGKRVFHYSGVSSFAQYAITLPGSLIKIDQGIPLDVAAMFGCAVITGAGSIFNTARVRPGQSVAVFGLGGVGLNAVMAARISGASEIIGIDINSNKFGLAEELGCTRTILATDPDLAEQVRDLTQGGVDYVIEVSGSKIAMASANEILRKSGEIICVGLGAFGDMFKYDHAMLVSEEKAIRGSFMGSSVPERDLPIYLKFFKDGKMPVDRLKTGTMGFESLNHNLDLLDRGSVVRQILLPHI